MESCFSILSVVTIWYRCLILMNAPASAFQAGSHHKLNLKLIHRIRQFFAQFCQLFGCVCD